MKNLFKFVTVLMILFGAFTFGQEGKQVAGNTPQTKDNERLKLATMIAQTKDNLSVVYITGMSYETFRSKVLGRSGAAVTTEGEALLVKVYSYLSTGTSTAQIISTDNGKEMGDAYIKLNRIGSDGSALFSTGSDTPKLDTNIHPHQPPAKGDVLANCKWYQISCWIDDIFGAGTAAALIKVLIAML